MKSASALGYLFVFAPPALLVAGRRLDADCLLFAAFFTVFPTLRLVFGASPTQAPTWSERVSAMLHALPRLYSAAFAALLLWLAWTVHAEPPVSAAAWIGFGASLWVAFGLANCVAHELVHRRGRCDRRAGHVVAALAGYPFLGFEHLGHHAQNRNTDMAHSPRVDESVWAFAARRAALAPRCAVQWSRATQERTSRPALLDSVWPSVWLTLSVLAGLAAAGGWPAALVYATMLVAVPFLLNAVTYMQHWGLGDDTLPHIDERHQLAWDEDCRLQAWLTLGLSHHQEHHDAPSKAYFLYRPSLHAPRLPAGYAIMVLICLVPPLWRRVMRPALQHWLDHPQRPRSAGRRLHCFSV